MPKSGNNTRIAKNSLFLYIRTFLVLLLNLYLSRLILDILGVEDYGIYNVVAGVVVMVGFLNNTMASATERFFAFEIGLAAHKNIQKLKDTFQTSLFIHLLIAFLVLIFAETIGVWVVNTKLNFPIEKLLAVNYLYQLSVATILVSFFQIPFKASIIAHEEFKIFAVIHVFEVFLKLISVIILRYIVENQIVYYGFFLLVVCIIISLIYFIYSKINFDEVSIKLKYEKKIYRTMLGYTSWNLFGNVAYVGSTQGVNILLNIFFNPIVNAAMGIAMQVQAAVKSFVSNIQLAINPQIIKSYAEKDLEYMKTLMYAGAKFSFFILFFIMFPILVETKFILEIWLKQIPAYTVSFTRIILITILIDSFSGTIMTGFQATGRIKIYQIIVGGILLLNVPLSYLFLKLNFTPETVVSISIFLSLLTLFIRLYLLKKTLPFYPLHFLKQVVLRSILTCFSTSSIVVLLTKNLSEGYLKLCLFIVLEAIIFFLSIFLFGLTKKEKKLIKSKIVELKQRL